MTPPPHILFGIETEIGIARDNVDDLDVVSESIALVRSVVEPGVLMRWDYGSEDPHADMRGFHVQELRQDTDEEDFYEEDSQRQLSYVEIKSDLVLGNGARFTTITPIPNIARRNAARSTKSSPRTAPVNAFSWPAPSN